MKIKQKRLQNLKKKANVIFKPRSGLVGTNWYFKQNLLLQFPQKSDFFKTQMNNRRIGEVLTFCTLIKATRAPGGP